MRTRAALTAAALAAVVLAGCGDDDDAAGDDTATTAAPADDDAAAPAGDGGIRALNFAFDPSELTVGAGESFTFTNDDDTEHSFTLDDEAAGVDVEAEGGDSADVTAPSEPGTYDFHCRYHPSQMTGTLTVE